MIYNLSKLFQQTKDKERITDTGIIFKTLVRNKREKRRWFPKNDF